MLWCNPKIRAVIKSLPRWVQPEVQSQVYWHHPDAGRGYRVPGAVGQTRAITTVVFPPLGVSLPATPNSVQHGLILIFTTAGKAGGARIGCEYGKR